MKMDSIVIYWKDGTMTYSVNGQIITTTNKYEH
jgi:hypothetical protein